MAINFFRIEILKVAEGDLPTRDAAYISRSNLRSAVTGERFYFKSKKRPRRHRHHAPSWR